MADITVKILKGRETWEIVCSPSTTFAQLRARAEARAGTIENGLRIFHKGRTPAGLQTLCDAGVTTGTKMMVMVTAKQCQVDGQREKAERLKEQHRALNDMRDKARGGAVQDGGMGGVVKNPVRGDGVVVGGQFVLLKKARDTFRVNIGMDATVGELKARTAEMEGIGAAKRDIKLLCGGKFLKDDAVRLKDCGMKIGGVVMVMFGMRHHDAKDANLEMAVVERETAELEVLVRGVVAKKRGRLLDVAGLAVDKGRVVEMLERLKDNVAAVRGEEERRIKVEERLRLVERDLEILG